MVVRRSETVGFVVTWPAIAAARAAAVRLPSSTGGASPPRRYTNVAVEALTVPPGVWVAVTWTVVPSGTRGNVWAKNGGITYCSAAAMTDRVKTEVFWTWTAVAGFPHWAVGFAICCVTLSASVTGPMGVLKGSPYTAAGRYVTIIPYAPR